MSRDNSQMFDRGQTWHGPDGTIDTNNYQAVHLEGQTKEFEDINYNASGSVKPMLSGQKVKCRCVRNVSGITLLGKRLVRFSPSNPGRVDGYATTEAEDCAVADEYLPSGGVRNGDLFWVVVEGPTTVLTPFSGAGFGGADFAAGARLHSLTSAAGSTNAASTHARPTQYTAVAATTAGQFTSLINHLTNWVGTAISAMTTGQTNTDMRIECRRRGAGV